MIFRIGIEHDNDGGTMTWTLDHPACFTYGRDREEAEKNFLAAAREYAAWNRATRGMLA